MQKCIQNWYNRNKDAKIVKSTYYYSKKSYCDNPDYKREASRKHYQNNPQPRKEASRDLYQKNPNPKKKAKECYQKNPGLRKQNSLQRYYENRDLRFTFADNEMDKLKVALNKENKKCLNKDYYERNYCQILYRLRSNYISEGSVSHINCVWPVFSTYS